MLQRPDTATLRFLVKAPRAVIDSIGTPTAIDSLVTIRVGPPGSMPPVSTINFTLPIP
jgi:hypothetical protein